MQLIGRDYQPPLASGSGEVAMQSLADLTYRFRASEIDFKALTGAMQYQRENSYQSIARMRLVGVDAEGVDWACGYTIPAKQDLVDGRFEAEGELESLICDDASASRSATSSTELIYSVDRLHPLVLAMRGQYEKKIEMLGSTITFTFEREAACLAIVAEHSEQLPPTYAEQWLVQPFRIMFGQPLMPRLYARNLGGHSMISVSTVPRVKNASWSAFWRCDDPNGSDFFECYSGLLHMIALRRDSRGEPIYELHPVTGFYDELSGVARASRWVMALALASTSEGLTKLLRPARTMSSDRKAERDEKVALIDVIESSGVSARLKSVAVKAVQNFSSENETIKNSLRRLAAQSIVTSSQFSAWNEIRNSVMHGTLMSPFSHEEEDAKLAELAELVRAVTRELLRVSSAKAS